MSRLLSSAEQPQQRRFWNGHSYQLNSQHSTKKDAHHEAHEAREMGNLARVVKVRSKYYVYLANARPRKSARRR